MDYDSARFPRDLAFGWGSIIHLKALGASRAFLVSDSIVAKMEGFRDGVQCLEEAKVEWELFDEVEPEPSIGTVLRGAERMRDFNPEVVIALGGGSAIDAAKAMRVFHEHPGLRFEEVRFPPRLTIPPLSRTRLIAIPTTSGTGSEATPVAIISEDTTKIKCPIYSPELIPDLAILDPSLAASMPPGLTAYTGLDALSHAIESFVSKRANPFSRPLSREAARLILDNLPRVFLNGDDREGREKMHWAASLAGLAFASTGLGLCHSMASPLGASFGIPHGKICGILLPYVIAFNVPAARVAYGEISLALGLRPAPREDPARALIRAVRELLRSLGVPLSLAECGIRNEEFGEKLDDLSELSFSAGPTLTNPRASSAEEVRALMECVYRGSEVTI